MSGAASDALKTLKGRFARHSAISMNAAGVTYIVEEIEKIRALVADLEDDNARLRWNAAAKHDRDRTDAILDAAMRPGSNVKLFPVAARPVFTDPKGAA